MNRQMQVVACLVGCMLVTFTGCASWSPGMFKAAKSEPTFESTLSLARLSERHGEPSTAKRLYNAVLAKDPQNQLAHHRLAVLATKEQKFDEAQEHFDLALKGQTDAQLLSDWGYCLYLIDKMPEAETALRKSLELDPSNIATHNNLGLVLGTLGRTDESLKEFRYAGDEASARANLAYVHSLNGKFDQSEAEYHHALKLNSQLKPAAEALLALHARNNAGTASALSYNPTISASKSVASQATDSTSDLPISTVATKQSPAADQTSQPFSAIATVSYTKPGDDSQPAGSSVANVQATTPLMNLPTLNPTQSTTESTGQTRADQQATPAPNFPAPSYARPMSIQSQPWQAPTWSPN